MIRSAITLLFFGLVVTPQEKARTYEKEAEQIIKAALESNGAYEKLEELCYGVGHRLSGSAGLEKAIVWAAAAFKKDGQENISTEPTQVTKWVRGKESAELVEPRAVPLAMLGLGGSVGTAAEGLTAEVVVVSDEEGLTKLGEGAKGKIVLFDNPMPAFETDRGSGYGETVRFRVNGPDLAGRKGAVGVLVRSVTATSLRSPHTGSTRYADGGRKIPAAAISCEDATMIHKLYDKGTKVVVCLKMEAKDEGMAPSANVIAELRGSKKPDEVVVIGGHLDSWDVGQGAHDDGAGVVTCMEVINLLRKLKLVPQRTIRVVLFTNEENGLAGARQYVANRKEELAKHVAALEMDSEGFRPTDLSVELSDKVKQRLALEQIGGIVKLVSKLRIMKTHIGGSGADVGQMKPAGVPCLGFGVAGDTYFDYHHTQADTLDKVDPKDLRECVAAMAVYAYVLADMPGKLGEE